MNWRVIIFIATIFTCIGALNWGSASIGNNCFRTLKDRHKIWGSFLYAIIGLAGIITLSYTIYFTFKYGINYECGIGPK